jgi:ketosteroid isomerase-like protein
MSQESVDLIARMYEAFHAGDAERAVAYFSDDVAVDATARVDGGTGRGREELGRIIGQWVGSFDEWSEEIEAIHDAGDRICVVAVQRGRAKDSGIEAETRYAVLYEIGGGAITRMKLYGDPAQALRDAGAETA